MQGPDGDIVQQLGAVFPNLEKSIVAAVWQQVGRDVERATECLSEISTANAKNDDYRMAPVRQFFIYFPRSISLNFLGDLFGSSRQRIALFPSLAVFFP